MPRTDIAPRSSADTIVGSGTRTSSNSSTPVTGFGIVSMLRVQLNVTAASGTTPTLDVVIADTLDGTNWNTIGTFTQMTTTGRQVINISAPFTDTLRATYTVAGTTPSFTFSVIAYSQ